MNEKLTEAFFDAPHRVLGRRLRPFTLRHAFVLSVGDNKLITEGEPTVGDLYQAVEICSRDPEFFFSDRNPSKLRRWFWEFRNRKADTFAEALKFQDYLEDYTASPSLWSKDSGTKRAACNWIIGTVSGLMARLGFSRAEAWNLSPGEASWYLAAAMESDPWSSIELVSDEVEEGIRNLQAMTEEEEAQFIARLTGKGASHGDSN